MRLCLSAFQSFQLGGWVVLALMAPGLIVLVGIVLLYVLRAPPKDDPAMPAPGYFHVMGVDRETGERRESTFAANSQQSAAGRAELEGIIVTEIRRVNG